VFFNDEQLVVGALDTVAEGLDIDGLNGEEIDDSYVDAFTSELFSSSLGFKEGDTGRSDGDNVVFGSLDDLSLTDFELFVVVVEDLFIEISKKGKVEKVTEELGLEVLM